MASPFDLRFARTYEGLKLWFGDQHDESACSGFARTYEGLKPSASNWSGSPHSGFARTYEGLKHDFQEQSVNAFTSFARTYEGLKLSGVAIPAFGVLKKFCPYL